MATTFYCHKRNTDDVEAETHLNFLPILALLGSMISLTVGTSYGKQLFPIIGPGGTAAYRVAFAAIILFFVFRPWKNRLSPGDLQKVTLYGVTLGLMNFMFYEAIGRLPLGIAIAIEFTGPLVVAVISSRRVIDFVWIVLTIIGLWLLLPIDLGRNLLDPRTVGAASSVSALDPMGIVFAFASALLWALYIIFGKRLSHLPSGPATSWGMIAAALTTLPLGFIETGTGLFQPQVLVAGIGLAVASSAVPYTLEMFALKRLPRNTFSILLSLEPAIGALTGFFVLSEVLTWTQWLAIACIMSASVGTAFGAKKEIGATSLEDVPADVL